MTLSGPQHRTHTDGVFHTTMHIMQVVLSPIESTLHPEDVPLTDDAAEHGEHIEGDDDEGMHVDVSLDDDAPETSPASPSPSPEPEPVVEVRRRPIETPSTSIRTRANGLRQGLAMRFPGVSKGIFHPSEAASPIKEPRKVLAESVVKVIYEWWESLGYQRHSQVTLAEFMALYVAIAKVRTTTPPEPALAFCRHCCRSASLSQRV